MRKDYNQRFGKPAINGIEGLEVQAVQQLIKDNPQILADLGMDIGRQNFSSVESTLGLFGCNILVFSI